MINRALASLRGFWDPSVSSDLEKQTDLQAYWGHYGGVKKLIASPYLLTALILTGIFAPYWTSEDWTEFASGILPNLLGFSVGAVAIILAVPSMRTFSILAEDGHPTSYFMDLASRLVHFIMIQVVALGAIMLATAYPHKVTNGIGFSLFIYAVLTAISAGLALFGIARILNAAAAFTPSDGDDETREASKDATTGGQS